MATGELHCIVRSFEKLTPTVYQLKFDTEPAMTFEAGQFMQLLIPGAGPRGRDLERPYSLASAPDQRPFELCIKTIEEGPGSSFLGTLREGSQFRARPPEGDFLYHPCPDRQVLFLATGTAIAPFRSMILSEEYKARPPRSATFVLGARAEDELLYMSEMSKLSDLQWLPTLTQPSDDWNGLRGRVTTWVRALPAEYPWAETEFYICGSGPMITEIKTILASRGVPAEAIHHEKFY
jgi:CDP-4-dehydro-6-deoxyglucose reductase